jgi:peptidoglycan/LPS O-acetylase OafA/YrhL
MSAIARDPRIDLLRGVSILLVLLHHFNLAYSLRGTGLARLVGWDAVHAVTRNGNYGVIMFFTISGYLITANAMRRWHGLARVDVREFYALRAARILPSLVLLLVMVNALGFCGLPLFQNHPEQGPAVPVWLVDAAALTFWMNVLMAQAGWLNYVLCVLWSLSVEEVFYLAFPLLCRGLRRVRWLLAVWLVFIVAGPVWRMLHQDDEAGFLYAYLACFDAIAMGCCAAVLAPRVAVPAGVARVLPGAAALAMAVLYLSASIGRTNVFGVTLMALGTVVLILSGRGRAVRRSGVAARAVQGCGRLSYELYLSHLLVLAGLRIVWPPDTAAGGTKLVLLVVFLGLSVLVGWLWARLYAEPVNRFVRLRAAVA